MRQIAAVLLALVGLMVTGCSVQATTPQPPLQTVMSAREFLSAGTDLPANGVIVTYLTSDPAVDGDGFRFSVGDDGATDFDVHLAGPKPEGLSADARVRFSAGTQWPGGALQVESIEVLSPAAVPSLAQALASQDMSASIDHQMKPLAVEVLGEDAVAYRLSGDKLARLLVMQAPSEQAARSLASRAVNRRDTMIGFTKWVAYQQDAVVILYALEGDRRNTETQLEAVFGQPVARTATD